MTKQLRISVFAAIALFCSVSFGQSFQLITPDTLADGLGSGGEAVNGIFDISSEFDLPANSFRLLITNGLRNGSNNTWAVAEGRSTTFAVLGDTSANAFVNHGANLGSEVFQNGSLSRDGIIAEPGEAWELRSELDSDYTEGRIGDRYFVDYTGDPNRDELVTNGQGFRFFSLQPVTAFTVFSSNTTEPNNNYNVGFQLVNAIPEPSAGIVLAISSLVFLRRKRS